MGSVKGQQQAAIFPKASIALVDKISGSEQLIFLPLHPSSGHPASEHYYGIYVHY